MKVTRERAELLAKAEIRIHNEASLEYKAAFAKIGARMWNHDYCHPYKRPDVTALGLAEAYMAPIRRGLDRADFIKSSWGRLPFPLTVLDSWRHISNFERKRESLHADVAKIHAKYQRRWRMALRSLLSTSR